MDQDDITVEVKAETSNQDQREEYALDKQNIKQDNEVGEIGG